MEGGGTTGADMRAPRLARKVTTEEDSWTSVELQELDHATSFVSESMYLVMENPAAALYTGEVVQLKVHAQCDKSTLGLAGAAIAGVAKSKTASTSGTPSALMTGTLFLTSYRLLFRSFHNHEEELVQVLLDNIAELAEFRAASKLGPMSQLEISCKNFEIVRFNFPGEAISGDIYVRINQLLGFKRPHAAFAFPDPRQLPDTAGWSVYDPLAEFTRLAFKGPKATGKLGGFRLTYVNTSYKVCPTYPSTFIVPSSVSDGELRKMSCFRARGRVPAVTYRHKNDAVIARCAQPLVGLRRKRCIPDEAYIAALKRECKGKLMFVDCRSQTSAYGNIALGGGFEVLDNYRDTNIMFMGIENIHAMRDSVRKLFDLIKIEVRGNERANWWSCLESTRWLEHVRSVLVSASICVSKLADEDTSLVIHCSDGWDRTAQIVSLTKICADPFYRTTKGFQVLVEQEWCAFGHQFRSRSGQANGCSYWEDDNTSPVFLQFVDAVWQLLRQFPCSFEFNERYLIALLDEVYNKKSGTFLHNCEEERMGSRTLAQCVSAWTLLAAHPNAADFQNPFYIIPITGDGSVDRSPSVLQFKWHTSSLATWSSFYLRSLESNDSRDAWAKELQVTQRELQEQLSSAHQKLQSQTEQNSSLQSELEKLRLESAQLRKFLEGQVISDSTGGVLVQEEEEDDDGVLLSVTSVHPSDGSGSIYSGVVGGHDTVSSSVATGSFLGATISQDFEILHSYFDPVKRESGSLASSGLAGPAASHSPTPSTMGSSSRAARSLLFPSSKQSIAVGGVAQ